MLFIYL